MSKSALITGITGQHGSYLAEVLIEEGYEIHGNVRRSLTINNERLAHIYQGPHDVDRRLILHYLDLTDGVSLVNRLGEVKPEDVYHLGAR